MRFSGWSPPSSHLAVLSGGPSQQERWESEMSAEECSAHLHIIPVLTRRRDDSNAATSFKASLFSQVLKLICLPLDTHTQTHTHSQFSLLAVLISC